MATVKFEGVSLYNNPWEVTATGLPKPMGFDNSGYISFNFNNPSVTNSVGGGVARITNSGHFVVTQQTGEIWGLTTVITYLTKD